MASSLSWALGAADNIYYGMRLMGPARPLFFSEGWGDIPGSKIASDRVLASLQDGQPPWKESDHPEIMWEDACVICDGVMKRSAKFASPEAMLPSAARTAHFELVAPTEHSEHGDWPPTCSGVVVLLPATGEQSIWPRLHLAKQLARDDKLCSIILVAPFYGTRKPPGQPLHYITRVDYFLLQSVAILQEAAMLSIWALKTFPRAPVCISGFSWGAAMCAGAALLASQWRPAEAHRVGCSPYVGSASPAVMAAGMLNGDICYDALVDKAQGEDAIACRQRLLSVLLDTHFDKFAARVTHPRLGCVEAVSCLDDHFVPAEWAQELFALLQGCCCKGRAHQQWIAGSHVTAFLRRGVQVGS